MPLCFSHYNARVGKAADDDDAIGEFGEDTCNASLWLVIMKCRKLCVYNIKMCTSCTYMYMVLIMAYLAYTHEHSTPHHSGGNVRSSPS